MVAGKWVVSDEKSTRHWPPKNDLSTFLLEHNHRAAASSWPSRVDERASKFPARSGYRTHPLWPTGVRSWWQRRARWKCAPGKSSGLFMTINFLTARKASKYITHWSFPSRTRQPTSARSPECPPQGQEEKNWKLYTFSRNCDKVFSVREIGIHIARQQFIFIK